MDFPALAQRIIYPRTDTPEAAWQAATNGGYAAAIMAASHLLLGTLLLSLPAPVAGALIQIGLGLVYLLLARLAFRRSRVASIVILGLIIFDTLVEFAFAGGLGPNHAVIVVALILVIGGLRGVNAVYSRHGRPWP